jgi:hypothetical protein
MARWFLLSKSEQSKERNQTGYNTTINWWNNENATQDNIIKGEVIYE